MLFNSVEFAFFFLIVTVLYFSLPHKFRWFLLLAASCYFYMAFVPVYILILGSTIIIDYLAGIYIERSEGAKRKFLLIVSLAANIGILVVFKYFNFLNANITQIYAYFKHPNPIPFLHMLLPIGLSFHTFQAMSYTIEVYRGNQAAEKHFGIYSLYVMFYPQLVAGPIERPQNMLHQFHEKHQFNYDDMAAGLRQMAWGLFKKAVIADRLGTLVNNVYASPENHTAMAMSTALVFFAFQIYCDFSGYSDIALGAARTMGFKLMTNFNHPFISTKVTEFWRRWHISLSTWLNDYLFTPIVIARRDWGKAGIVFALFFTFFISGIWHGAGWTFIIYGILNGIAVIYEFLTNKTRKKLSKKIPAVLYRNVSIVLTFVYMCFTWVFFRSQHIHTAFYIIKTICAATGNIFRGSFAQWKMGAVGMNGSNLLLCFILIIGLLLIEKAQERFDIMKRFLASPAYIRWPLYLGFVLLIMAFGVFEKSQFIYFQF